MELQSSRKPGGPDASTATAAPHLSARPPDRPLIHLQHQAGNRATSNLLQSRYKIDRPGGPQEQEADRVSSEVMAMADSPVSGGEPLVSAAAPPDPPPIQRACAKCEENLGRKKGDEEQPLQAKEAGNGSLTSDPSIDDRIAGLKGGGDPLPAPVKDFFEPRFGRDFGNVRIHTGTAASDSARDLGALAFTLGSDIALAPGQFSPASDSGRRLLAHELTHVVQQGQSGSKAGGVIQRQTTADQSPAATAPATAGPAPGEAREPLIVEDDADIHPGQMKKTEFLSRVQSEVCRESDDAMKGTDRTTEGCPYVEKWFAYYADKSSAYIERALRKYAPEAARAATAAEYIPLVAARVRRSVEVWARTGEITGVPDELVGAVMGGGILGAIGSAIGSAVSGIVGGIGRAISGIGSLFFKGREAGTNTNADPAKVKSDLGAGESLGGAIKARMESAFGQDFSSVRIHTGPRGAELADSLNARAFTVGHEIAFGAGEYRPETIVGDALIAHELAHVVQQGSGEAAPALMPQGRGRDDRLEEDADLSAAYAAAFLWGGAYRELSGLQRNALPRLRSGLQLQRCSNLPATKNPFEAKEAELFQKAEQCAKLGARLPAAYEPDFAPIVSVAPEEELYEYDFTFHEMELYEQACKNRLEAAGCTALQAPPNYQKIITPGACFKKQVKDGMDFNSPIEAGLATFPVRNVVYVPIERLSEKEVTRGLSDNTLNHELHHLVVNYTIMQEFKGRLAARIRDRLMDIRRQAAQHPENREKLLAKAPIEEMMKQEAQPFYDWYKTESERRHEPIDLAGALPPVTIPSSWKNFKRPVPKAGDKGSFTT